MYPILTFRQTYICITLIALHYSVQYIIPLKKINMPRTIENIFILKPYRSIIMITPVHLTT